MFNACWSLVQFVSTIIEKILIAKTYITLYIISITIILVASMFAIKGRHRSDQVNHETTTTDAPTTTTTTTEVHCVNTLQLNPGQTTHDRSNVSTYIKEPSEFMHKTNLEIWLIKWNCTLKNASRKKTGSESCFRIYNRHVFETSQT